MKNYLGYELMLGKRWSLAPLDFEKFYGRETKDKPENKSQSRADLTFPHFSENKLKMEIEGTQNLLNEREPKTHKKHKVKVDLPSKKVRFIHTKMWLLYDILKEMCVTNNFNVRRYRNLDERQKSLLNKILQKMLEPNFLDLIDTYQQDYISTSDYIIKDLKGRHSLILHLRFQSFKNLNSKLIDPSEEAEDDNTLNFRQISNLIGNQQLQTVTVSEMNMETANNTPTNLLLNEVLKIQSAALSALSLGRQRGWLSQMLRLLRKLIEVPVDSIIQLYCEKIEIRLTHFFYDEQNDVNKFFTRLKSKLKSGDLLTPVTKHQLQIWDKAVVDQLCQQISKLEEHLEKSKD